MWFRLKLSIAEDIVFCELSVVINNKKVLRLLLYARDEGPDKSYAVPLLFTDLLRALIGYGPFRPYILLSDNGEVPSAPTQKHFFRQML